MYLSKVYFCEMYPTCVSSKLCEFIDWQGHWRIVIDWFWLMQIYSDWLWEKEVPESDKSRSTTVSLERPFFSHFVTNLESRVSNFAPSQATKKSGISALQLSDFSVTQFHIFVEPCSFYSSLSFPRTYNSCHVFREKTRHGQGGFATSSDHWFHLGQILESSWEIFQPLKGAQ